MVVLAVLVLQARRSGIAEAATATQAAPVAVVARPSSRDAIAHEGIRARGAIRAERTAARDRACRCRPGELTAAVVADLTDDRPDRLIVHAGRDLRVVTARPE